MSTATLASQKKEHRIAQTESTPTTAGHHKKQEPIARAQKPPITCWPYTKTDVASESVGRQTIHRTLHQPNLNHPEGDSIEVLFLAQVLLSSLTETPPVREENPSKTEERLLSVHRTLIFELVYCSCMKNWMMKCIGIGRRTKTEVSHQTFGQNLPHHLHSGPPG